MKNISQITEMPTVIGNTHESVLQSYHILQLVKEMLKRGDSGETILSLINHIQNVKTIETFNNHI